MKWDWSAWLLLWQCHITDCWTAPCGTISNGFRQVAGDFLPPMQEPATSFSLVREIDRIVTWKYSRSLWIAGGWCSAIKKKQSESESKSIKVSSKNQSQSPDFWMNAQWHFDFDPDFSSQCHIWSSEDCLIKQDTRICGISLACNSLAIPLQAAAQEQKYWNDDLCLTSLTWMAAWRQSLVPVATSAAWDKHCPSKQKEWTSNYGINKLNYDVCATAQSWLRMWVHKHNLKWARVTRRLALDQKAASKQQQFVTILIPRFMILSDAHAMICFTQTWCKLQTQDHAFSPPWFLCHIWKLKCSSEWYILFDGFVSSIHIDTRLTFFLRLFAINDTPTAQAQPLPG